MELLDYLASCEWLHLQSADHGIVLNLVPVGSNPGVSLEEPKEWISRSRTL